MPDNRLRLQEGQSAVTVNTQKLINRNRDRRSILITNAGANAIYMGTKDSLTTGSGHYIASGSSVGTGYQGDVYFVSAVGGSTVTWLEESIG